MHDPQEHLATSLKAVRKQRKLSLDALAALTGVSKAMLGQIERGESSPTVQTLWRIATGLGISLSHFIEPQPPGPREVVMRNSDDIRQHPAGAGLQVAALFPYDPHFGFEWLELTFLPGYDKISEPHETGVTEFVSVIEGEMEFLADGIWHAVKTGQSIRFPADQEHGYRNHTDRPARIITVNYYGQRDL